MWKYVDWSISFTAIPKCDPFEFVLYFYCNEYMLGSSFYQLFYSMKLILNVFVLRFYFFYFCFANFYFGLWNVRSMSNWLICVYFINVNVFNYRLKYNATYKMCLRAAYYGLRVSLDYITFLFYFICFNVIWPSLRKFLTVIVCFL